MLTVVLHLATALLAMASLPSSAEAKVELPVQRLLPEHVALVINENDPYSVAIGGEYARQRGIPDDNVIRVRFAVQANMPRKAFNRVKGLVDAATPPGVQAYALAWTQPFKVACMSVTSAFALGLDESYCAKGCRDTRRSVYFDSDTRRPFDELGVRPAMSLAASDVAGGRALIERGLSADHSWPEAPAYLVRTSDKRRNVRAYRYSTLARQWQGEADIRVVSEQEMAGVEDILFYFTGTARVQGLERNGFVEGAIGDHLTSAGGRLTSDKQMSALRWLDAGTSGSYGTVVEPCNITGKFPDPAIVIERYLRGETLLEAYWKSVAMPGQGVFIGDPLTAPFAGARVSIDDGQRTLQTRELEEGDYAVFGARHGEPFAALGNVQARGRLVRELALPGVAYDCYRVTAAGGEAGGRCK
ncbi:MAG: TIGR03790 family protein [Pseudomonadota bacterium]